jgi:redox-sensing transcriptional repressor
MRRKGEEYISGTTIVRELHLESIQVRKDLCVTGVRGEPGKGFPVDPLINAIECFLGWDTFKNAVIVGAGNLGAALIGYPEFQIDGLNIIAAFDNDPQKIGLTIHGIPVFAATTIDLNIRLLNADIAILAVPSVSAQEITDALIKAGIKGIWNFTGVKLRTPPHVAVQDEAFFPGYAMLCKKMRFLK